jgi:hypothetical protein
MAWPEVKSRPTKKHIIKLNRFFASPPSDISVSKANFYFFFPLTSSRKFCFHHPDPRLCPDYVLPDYDLPDYVLPDYVLPNYVLPNYVLPNYVLPNYVLPAYVLPYHCYKID